MIRNVHSREFACEPARVGQPIDSLASADDQLWPVPRWPAMELDHGLRPGSRGGHGPVRYAVDSVDPGRAVVFRFDPAIGLQGTHGFSVSSDGHGRTTLTHVLEARPVGAGRLLWPLAVRWMHEALIEDAFDRAAATLGEREWVPRRLGLWVRLWRAVAKRTLGSAERSSQPSNALPGDDGSLVGLVEAVRALPYGRPESRTVAGMLAERRGTCSTKHLYLARELRRRFPETEPELMHRVFRVTPGDAATRFGPAAAAAVPAEGLVDVHRYVTAVVEGRWITLDATFPSDARWDGHSPMPLACAAGTDHPAGNDPDSAKRALEAEHCDPRVREPFIAALGTEPTAHDQA